VPELCVKSLIHEAQRQIAGVLLIAANVMELLPQALVQESLVRVLLHLDEVGHPDDFVDVGEAHPLFLAEFYGLDFPHKIDHSLLLYSTDVRTRRPAGRLFLPPLLTSGGGAPPPASS